MFNRARSSNRRTTAERRVASQVDESSGSAGLTAQDGPPAPAFPSSLAKTDTKSRSVSSPVQVLSGFPSLDERIGLASRLSLSTSSAGSTIASPPPPPYPSLRRDSSLVDDKAGDDTNDIHGINLEGLHKEVQTSAPVTEEWVKERSREELDLLLLEADRVIREREKGALGQISMVILRG